MPGMYGMLHGNPVIDLSTPLPGFTNPHTAGTRFGPAQHTALSGLAAQLSHWGTAPPAVAALAATLDPLQLAEVAQLLAVALPTTASFLGVDAAVAAQAATASGSALGAAADGAVLAGGGGAELHGSTSAQSGAGDEAGLRGSAAGSSAGDSAAHGGTAGHRTNNIVASLKNSLVRQCMALQFVAAFMLMRMLHICTESW